MRPRRLADVRWYDHVDPFVGLCVVAIVALIAVAVVGTLWSNDWDARCLFVECVVVKEDAR